MPKCTCCGKRIKKGDISCQFCGTVYHDPKDSSILEKSSGVDFFSAEETTEDTGYDFSEYSKSITEDDNKYKPVPSEPETVAEQVQETPIMPSMETNPYNPIPQEPVRANDPYNPIPQEPVRANNPYNPIPQEPRKSSSAKVGIIIATVLSIFVGLVVLIVAGTYGVTKYKEKKLEDARIAWQSKNYVLMDDFYTRRDFDGLDKFLQNESDNEGFYPYPWEHYEVYSVYVDYVEFMEDKETFWEDGEMSQKWTLYNAVFIDYSASEERYGIPEEDKLIVAEWTKDTDAFYREVLKLDDKGIDEMKAFVCDDTSIHFPSSQQCAEYLSTHY